MDRRLLYSALRAAAAAVVFVSLGGCCVHPGVLPGAPPATKAIGMMYNYPSLDPAKPSPPPGFFVRAATSLARHGDSISIPEALPRVLYEGELVVVIGQHATKMTPELAKRCILGYTCGMDGSPEVLDARGERDVARSIAGKSADGIAPVGPILVENLDISTAEVVLRVNGKEVERARPRELVWDVPTLISRISQTVTLNPGDVIFTGATRAVPKLEPGDEVDVEIAGIGTLRNKVVQGRPSR